MNSKVIVLLFIHYIFTINSIVAQSSFPTESFTSSKLIGTIEKATGWVYNNHKDSWINKPNYIVNPEKNQPKLSDNKAKMAMAYQNFSSISLQTTTYKQETFYILKIESWKGNYKYPTLEKDWTYHNQIDAYIFDFQYIRMLKNISRYICVSTSHKITVTGNNQEEQLRNNIKRELIRFPSQSTPQYTFVVRKLDDKSIHFLLPEHYTKNPILEIQNRYFEISLKTYQNLVGLPSESDYLD